jgi:hypothetical protein
MKVDERSRYTDEERSLILSHMLDLSIDKLGKNGVDAEKLMWLKLKKMHDDISDRAQVTSTQHRWLAFFALVIAGLSSSLPQIVKLIAGDTTFEDAWSNLISPTVGFAVALYIILHPLHTEKRMFEPSFNTS